MFLAASGLIVEHDNRLPAVLAAVLAAAVCPYVDGPLLARYIYMI